MTHPYLRRAIPSVDRLIALITAAIVLVHTVLDLVAHVSAPPDH